MATTNRVPSDPLEAPLPPLPTEEVFTELQWETLLSLADVVIPSIRLSGVADPLKHKGLPEAELEAAKSKLQPLIKGPDQTRLATQYLADSPSSNPAFRDFVQRLFSRSIPTDGRNGFASILSALNTSVGSLFLTGSATPIQTQSFEVRERAFRSWEDSRLPQLRAVFKAINFISRNAWLSVSPAIGPILGFPRTPVSRKEADGFAYQFLQFPPGDKEETIETDVVIVGSGCGGGVAAKNLSEAGNRVVVVEKSYHFSPKYFPMAPKMALSNLYENGGAISTEDGNMTVFSGSTWGGGGTVNWAASLQTQGYVRQEWADSGLPFFTSSEFQNSLDRVCDRMGVNLEHVAHNHANRTILEGCRRLGYAAKAVPLNTGNQGHDCGHCMLGCSGSIKQGPAVSFLVDAAHAGALFIEGFRADRILFDTVNGEKRASGVEGLWISRDSYFGAPGEGAVKRKVIIKAKRVIVSCGALQSPLLLMRSGIRNPNIGRHLHLHPVLLAAAVFEEELKPWDGSCLTAVVNEFENLDGRGHGAKIEACAMIPSSFLGAFPRWDGVKFKMLTAKYRHMDGFIVLCRERYGTGRVYPDPVDGRCRINYKVSSFDRNHLVESLIGMAKIAYVSGATEFHPGYGGLPSYIRPPSISHNTHSSSLDGDDPASNEGVNDPSLQAWIKEFRSKAPLNPEKAVFVSAHQMGTCRMGTSPKNSVVDPDGQVWGVQGLYVADASVFPSASGVNPMITNMAISDWTSQKVARRLNLEKFGSHP